MPRRVRFRAIELFGLTNQRRRAASSVQAKNIAEGCGRNGDAELARFMDIAMGSATELSYHLILARDLGYLPPERFEHLSFETEEIEADPRLVHRPPGPHQEPKAVADS